MRIGILATLGFGLLLAACGGSGSGSGGGGSGGAGASTSAGGTTTTSNSGGTTTTNTGGTTTTTTTPTVDFPVVINEMHATGEDWVELVNKGTTPVDLQGYGLTDSDAMGAPSLAHPATFPAGTVLGGGDRLLVVLEQDPLAGVGPQTTCLTTGGPSTCYYATWGISNLNGEKVFLLAPDQNAVGEAECPPNGAVDPNPWGRLPDKTGNFAVTAATPGTENAAP